MKQTLLLLIIAVGMVGCKDEERQKPLYQHNELLPAVMYNPDSSVRMTIDNHWCIYDSCPHIMESGIGISGSTKSGRALKWTDASKAKRLINFTITDSLGNIIEDNTFKNLDSSGFYKGTMEYHDNGFPEGIKFKRIYPKDTIRVRF